MIAVIVGVVEMDPRAEPVDPRVPDRGRRSGDSFVTNTIKGIVDRARPDHRSARRRRSAPRSRAATRRRRPRCSRRWRCSPGGGGRRSARAILAGVAVGLAVAVACSRVLLDLHWVSDVVAGLDAGMGLVRAVRDRVRWLGTAVRGAVEQASRRAAPRRASARGRLRALLSGGSRAVGEHAGVQRLQRVGVLAGLGSEDRHACRTGRPARSCRSSCRTSGPPGSASARTAAARRPAAQARRSDDRGAPRLGHARRRAAPPGRAGFGRASRRAGGRGCAASIEPAQRDLGDVRVVDVAADQRDRRRRPVALGARRDVAEQLHHPLERPLERRPVLEVERATQLLAQPGGRARPRPRRTPPRSTPPGSARRATGTPASS